MFQSEDKQFNQVKEFHLLMDGKTQEAVQAFDENQATFRSEFKIEEIVEFLSAAVDCQEAFEEKILELHQAVDKAAKKVLRKGQVKQSLVGQVDALLDLLYFTYGSFVLMGVDPKPIFDIVHRANMGKRFPDGQAHFDPVTHKILKPENWEQDFAPEKAILESLQRQGKRK